GLECGGRLVVVGTLHRLRDPGTHLAALHRPFAACHVGRLHRIPRPYRGGFPVLVDGDEHQQAGAGGMEDAFARVGGRHLAFDVHGGAAGVDDGGGHLHQVAGADVPAEADVPHVGGDAVAPRPGCRARVGGLVDPFQD